MNQPLSFQIKGMTCTSCEMLISEELQEVKGISDIAISHKTGQGSLVYNPSLVTDNMIRDAVTKAGYEAVLQDMPKSNSNGLNKNTLLFKDSAKETPIKVTFQTKIEAKGKITQDAQNNFIFDGEFENNSSTKITLPKGIEARSKE
ncbi:heavy-metal-associated domain-containing protein [Candidatus Gottesmanbacteria bacterium]|nr:heavy-metal-associated domain-containing protein [Candidatus Gottesmanbacteria bacterium]